MWHTSIHLHICLPVFPPTHPFIYLASHPLIHQDEEDEEEEAEEQEEEEEAEEQTNERTNFIFKELRIWHAAPLPPQHPALPIPLLSHITTFIIQLWLTDKRTKDKSRKQQIHCYRYNQHFDYSVTLIWQLLLNILTTDSPIPTQ